MQKKYAKKICKKQAGKYVKKYAEYVIKYEKYVLQFSREYVSRNMQNMY